MYDDGIFLRLIHLCQRKGTKLFYHCLSRPYKGLLSKTVMDLYHNEEIDTVTFNSYACCDEINAPANHNFTTDQFHDFIGLDLNRGLYQFVEVNRRTTPYIASDEFAKVIKKASVAQSLDDTKLRAVQDSVTGNLDPSNRSPITMATVQDLLKAFKREKHAPK